MSRFQYLHYLAKPGLGKSKNRESQKAKTLNFLRKLRSKQYGYAIHGSSLELIFTSLRSESVDASDLWVLLDMHRPSVHSRHNVA